MTVGRPHPSKRKPRRRLFSRIPVTKNEAVSFLLVLGVHKNFINDYIIESATEPGRYFVDAVGAIAKQIQFVHGWERHINTLLRREEVKPGWPPKSMRAIMHWLIAAGHTDTEVFCITERVWHIPRDRRWHYCKWYPKKFRLEMAVAGQLPKKLSPCKATWLKSKPKPAPRRRLKKFVKTNK